MPGTTTANDARLAALRKLGEAHGLNPEACDNTGEEDLLEILESDAPCPRWASVTTASEYRYVKVHRTVREARFSAVENVDDGIYAECPLAIVDLDTGRTLEPDWNRLPWRLA